MAETKKTAVKKAAPKKTVKKTVAKKAVAATTKKGATTKVAPKAASKATQAEPKLHYNKEKVLKDYSNTFKIMMAATAISIGFIFLYFMVFVVYLGGVSHSKHDPFYEKFNDRIDLSGSYDGQPLPVYEEQ